MRHTSLKCEESKSLWAHFGYRLLFTDMWYTGGGPVLGEASREEIRMWFNFSEKKIQQDITTYTPTSDDKLKKNRSG